MWHFQTGILVFFLALSIYTKAQQARLFKPSLALHYTYVPESKLQDSAGSYSKQSGQLSFFIPIYNHIILGDSTHKSSYFQLMTNGSAAWSSADLSNVMQQQHLLGASLGLSAFLVKNRKNIFSLSVSSMSRNDNYTLGTPEIRYAGLAQYRRNVSKGFSFHMGLGYSYFIGRGILFPALGMSFKTGKRSRMIINFPSRISFVQRIGNKVRLTAYLKPQGGFNYISNRSEYSQFPKAFYFRQRENHIGITTNIKLSNSFTTSADIGYAFRRSIRLSEGLQKNSSTFYKSGINNGAYIGVGLKYIFGSPKRDKEKEIIGNDSEKEELLSDPDFYDIISE
ncbi:MAG: hypothetical protein IPP32_17460 [Bacteroidetes bacterium]|nr:hypothetical protein [Bacteroidota bacterium]